MKYLTNFKTACWDLTSYKMEHENICKRFSKPKKMSMGCVFETPAVCLPTLRVKAEKQNKYFETKAGLANMLYLVVSYGSDLRK